MADIGIVGAVGGIQGTLKAIGLPLSMILFMIAGIVYAFGTMQPAEQRGKYQTWAISVLIGAVIIAAITGGAEFLASQSKTLLTTNSTATGP